MRFTILVALGLLIHFTATAQTHSTLDDLKFYADVIANAGNPIHKERAHETFAGLFDEWIHSEAFNEEDLNSIQWLSVKQPEDMAFTVITWQLALDENDHQYFGYLLWNGNVFPLNNTPFIDDLEYDVLSTDNWAGALYYNIHTVSRNGQKLYVLFGYNGFKNYEHRKIADVLYFQEGAPVFGNDIFRIEKEGQRTLVKNRLVLDYSNDANVSLNYNPAMDMIVFDHLIARIGRIPGQGPTMLPDGSYVGYKWDGTYFNYIDKLYTQTQDEPPMPKPILGADKGKNIFGKEKDKKN